MHLYSQSRGSLRFDDAIAAFVPDKAVQKQRSAGACAGSFALADCVEQGFEAGLAAAGDAGFRASSPGARPSAALAGTVDALRPVWLVPSEKPATQLKAFVDHQNDVTAADLLLAHREGYRSVEHLKRYTTMGMGTDQGKTSNVNALALMAQTLGTDVAAVGITTFRPPYTPVTIGAFGGHESGDLLDPDPPHRRCITGTSSMAPCSRMSASGGAPGTTRTRARACMTRSNREVKAVRTSVGLLDASTLGKIDIQGPDAAELLNWVYTNAWSKLEVGRSRYGVMCGEDGMVFDDGVTTRLGRDHFLMTTTTGGAARVLGWLEEMAADANGRICGSTAPPSPSSGRRRRRHRAARSQAAGRADRRYRPRSRDLPVHVVQGRHCRRHTGARLPHQLHRRAQLRDQCASRATRMALWRALHGGRREIRHHALRHRGHACAARREGLHHRRPGDRRHGHALRSRHGLDRQQAEEDFLGKRSLTRPDTARADRKQLVGLLTDDPNEVIPEGGQIVAELKDKPPMAMLGHVTSSYYSPNCGRSIALALVKNGRGRLGETVHVPLEGRTIRAKIAEPRFFDPEGKRLDG